MIEVGIVRDENGNQSYINMPVELENFRYQYTDDEIYDKFITVMECLTTMHA